MVKNEKDYVFNLDAIRVPTEYINQKRKGKLVNNQAGKNPGDVWHITKINSPAIFKHKTAHPTQYPNELVYRCLSATTEPRTKTPSWCFTQHPYYCEGAPLVLDPFMGSGTTAEQVPMCVVDHLTRSIGVGHGTSCDWF